MAGSWSTDRRRTSKPRERVAEVGYDPHIAGPGDDADLFVQVAEYAADVWKTDIISMSISLDTAPENVRERINAVTKRALVFAAAGNNN